MTRQIEKQMIQAIREQRSWASGNTRVSTGDEGSRVTLHGNVIARNTGIDGWEFNLCGWNTPTTRSRINAIAREFGRDSVFTRGGVPYECVPVPEKAHGVERREVPVTGWF